MLTAIAVTGAGLVGGVYAAFSTMVLPALDRQGAPAATRTMIAVNRMAERGPFIVLFGGTALSAVALAVARLPDGFSPALLAAGLSVAGTAITVVVNVPLNNRLERQGAAYWPTYRRRWGRWNAIRALLSAGAVAAVLASSSATPDG